MTMRQEQLLYKPFQDLAAPHLAFSWSPAAPSISVGRKWLAQTAAVRGRGEEGSAGSPSSRWQKADQRERREGSEDGNGNRA